MKKKLNIESNCIQVMYDVYVSNVFIHGPYDVNISKSSPWQIKRIQEMLKDAKNRKCKGFIMHIGKGYPYTDNFLTQVKDYGPLVLETTAYKTDYTSPESFVELAKRHELPVCIDTCHVFAAGYDPYTYIEYVKNSGVKIALYHLNDSKYGLGSNKDRHEFPGLGEIGYEKMTDIYNIIKDENYFIEI